MLLNLVNQVIKFHEDSAVECVSHDVPDSFVMSVLDLNLEELKKARMELEFNSKTGQEYADACSADTIGGLSQRNKDDIIQGFRMGAYIERGRLMDLLYNRESTHPVFKIEFGRIRSEMMGWKKPS